MRRNSFTRSAAMLARAKSTHVGKRVPDTAVERHGSHTMRPNAVNRRPPLGAADRGPVVSPFTPLIMGDPLQAFETINRSMDAMVSDAFRMLSPFMPPGSLGVGSMGGMGRVLQDMEHNMERTLQRTVGRTHIAVDVAEFSDRYEIHADLPGMPKSSIGVSIDEDTWPQTLTITAHRSIEGPARGEQGEAGDQPADASVVDVGGTEAEKGESLKPSAPRSVSQGEAGATRKAAGKDESEEGKGKHASTSSHSPSTKNSSVQAWHRTERVSGTVSRTLALPSDADTAGVGARLEEGVLTVTVPRKKVAEAEEIPGRRRVTIEHITSTMESPVMILSSAWRPLAAAPPIYSPQPCLEVYTSGGQACWNEPSWGCMQTPVWAAPPSRWQSLATYQVRGDTVRPLLDGWGASGPTTVRPPSSWWDDIHSRVSVKSSWYSAALRQGGVLIPSPGPRPAPKHKQAVDAIRYRPLPPSLPLQDSRGRSGLISINPYRSPSAWLLDCGRAEASWAQYSWSPQGQREAWSAHRSTAARAAHKAVPAVTVAAPWMRTLVHTILAPLVQFFTLACLLGYACLWTRSVLLDQRIPEGTHQRLHPAAYTGTTRMLVRMAWALPAILALASTPLLFDPVTQPFWVYLCAGVFAWWSAHKVLAACMDRGPLKRTATLRETSLVLLAPAAFVHLRPESHSGRQQEEGGSTELSKHAQAAQTLLHESSMTLLQRAMGKLCVALCLAIAMLRLRGAGTGAPPATSTQGSSSCWLNDIAFDLIIYCFFSCIMDGSAALLRSQPFGRGLLLLPHFDQPWLSTSFREFWTHRWNLSAGRLLRELVYEPLVEGITHAWPHAQGQAQTEHDKAQDSSSSSSSSSGSSHLQANIASPYHTLKRRAGSGAVEQHLPHHLHHQDQDDGGRAGIPRTQQAAGASTGESEGAAEAEQPTQPSLAQSIRASLPGTEEVKAMPDKMVQRLSAHATHATERIDVHKPAKLLGTLATFLVSGLMHEMILWYESRGVPLSAVTARASHWSRAHESWPVAWVHREVLGRMPIFLHKLISKSAGWLLPPLYTRAAGYMLCFFLANGALCSYESLLHQAWRRHGARLGYRGPLLGAPGSIQAKLVHALLSTLVLGLQVWLAHAFWWPAFVHTGLDTRLMNEWAGWLAPLGLNLPRAGQPMLCLA